MPWLFLPAFVTAKALREGFRGLPGLPPFYRFRGSQNSRYGVARPLPRLAFCGFFFASFFRSAATANRRVSRLAQQPEGLGLDAIKPICSILRKKEAKKAEGQVQAEWRDDRAKTRAARKSRSKERRQGGEATIPTGASAIRKAPGGRGRTLRPMSRLSLSSPAVVSWCLDD